MGRGPLFAVHGGAKHTIRSMALPDGGPTDGEVGTILIWRVWRRVEMVVGLCLADGRGQVGRPCFCGELEE